MTDVVDAWGDVEPVGLDEDAPARLRAMVNDPVAGWYARRRLRAMAAAGWNPDLHVRGADGRFIEMGGFARWLSGGTWQRGRVVKLQNGNVVTEDVVTGQKRLHKPGSLYAVPKPKAKLELPDPTLKGPHVPESGPAFAKVGGQGGSNPGGLFAVTESKPEPSWGEVQADQAMALMSDKPPKVITLGETKGQKLAALDAAGVDLIAVPNSDGSVALWRRTIPSTMWHRVGKVETSSPMDVVLSGHDSVVGTTTHGLADETAALALAHTPAVLGDKFYVKRAKSPQHARNEALANFLYELAGVGVPDVAVGADGETVSSRIIDAQSFDRNNPDHVAAVGKDFLFDAWLANWDVIGLDYDNVKIDADGNAWRIDAGGALMYRAQGGPKGHMWGVVPGELHSLRQASVNPQAAKVFGKVTNESLRAQADRLAAITPAAIREATFAHGMPESMADTLVARRAALLKEVGWTAVPEPVVPEATSPLPQPATPTLLNTPPQAVAARQQFMEQLQVTTKAREALQPGDVFVLDNDLYVYGATLPTPDGAAYTAVSATHVGMGTPVNLALPAVVPVMDDTDTLAPDYTPKFAAARKEVLAAVTAANLSDADMRESLMEQFDPQDVGFPLHVAFDYASTWDSNFSVASGYDDKRPVVFLTDGAVYAAALDAEGVPAGYVGVTNLTTGEKLVFHRDGFWNNFAALPIVARSPIAEEAMRAQATAAAPAIVKPSSEGWVTPASASLPDVPTPDVETAPAPAAPALPGVQPYNPDTPHQWVNTERFVPLGVIDPSKLPTVKTREEALELPEVQAVMGQWVVSQNQVAQITDVSVSWKGQLLFTTTGVTGSKFSAHGGTLTLVEEPTVVPFVPKFRQNGDIEIEGVVVGTWEKVWSGFRYTISPQYTPTGVEFSQVTAKKMNLTSRVQLHALSPLTLTKPKATKTEQIKTKLTNTTAALGLLGDGTAPAKGDWVYSTNNGEYGQVFGEDPSADYIVITIDGKKKARSRKSLIAATGPGTPPAVIKDKTLTINGTQVGPGALVGYNGDTVLLLDVTPDKAKIRDTNGKATWVAPSKLTTTTETTAFGVIEFDDLPEETSPVAMIAPGKVKFPGPGGAIIQQDSSKAAARAAKGMLLTRDGFAPEVGIVLRDNKGTRLVVSVVPDAWDKNRDSIEAFDPSKNAWTRRKISTLHVDHAAMLTDTTGNPLPRLATVNVQGAAHGWLPGETLIAVPERRRTAAGRYVDAERYIVLRDGAAVSADGKRVSVGTFGTHWSNMRRVGVLDPKGNAKLTIYDTAGSGMALLTDTEADADALYAAQIAARDAAKPPLTTLTPQQLSLAKLPHPPQTVKATTDKLPPVISAEGVPLTTVPSVPGVMSVEQAVAEVRQVVERNRATGRNDWATRYALADSDLIEDMLVQVQLVRDGDGNEFIETRYHLEAAARDDLRSRMVTRPGDTFGAWSAVSTSVKNIVPGDRVSVRVSSEGRLKPSSGNEPNAIVVSAPELLAGYVTPTYKVTVTVPDDNGATTTAVMYVEDRTSGIPTYSWDENKLAFAGSGEAVLNPAAITDGWSVVHDRLSYPSKGSQSSSTNANDAGVKVTDAFSSHFSSPGMMVSRQHEGGNVLVGVSSKPGHQANTNGSVYVRVPANDPEAARKTSELMQLTGVPVSAQTPTSEAIKTMALRKVVKQLQPTYVRGERLDVSDEKVALRLIEEAVPTLGRPATLDDIRVVTEGDGRVMVLFSQDVADAMAKASGVGHFYHSFGDIGAPMSILAGRSPGLLATSERWQSGLQYLGQSSDADHRNAAADRLFLRASPGTSQNNHRMAVVEARQAYRHLDMYWRAGDKWGARSEDYGANRNYLKPSFGTNELMLKRGLTLRDFHSFVFSYPASAIGDLEKDFGTSPTTPVINGRTVADYISPGGQIVPLPSSAYAYETEVGLLAVIG